MLDLTLEITEARDQVIPQRDNTMLSRKRVVFYLGKYGPFTEYFPAGEFTDLSMRARVDALKQQLEAMHR